jgi:ATP phosphoribosyltransferase regulatory subunit
VTRLFPLEGEKKHAELQEMAAETAKKFEALEAQASRLMGVFIAAGYEAVAPAMIQPAGVYLDAIGEALRARTYVFTDPGGDELCLRPDLTVPTCRLYLERNGTNTAEARYCYNGAAFRFQPQGADKAHPREFRQAGIESFGVLDACEADAETLITILEALEAAGLDDYRLRLGDLGLFDAILKTVAMPERWRQRLKHHFWHPEAFRAELGRLATAPGDLMGGIPDELARLIDPASPAEAEQAVARYLEIAGIEAIGVRSVAEITANLLSRSADARAEPLSATAAGLIESYLAVAGPALKAGSAIKDVVRAEGVDIADALIAYQRRLSLLSNAGIDLARAEFSAEFGRTLEYYTGFVFEIVVPKLGVSSPVAGGGRYDGLMKGVGAAIDIPAVGAAIHTERLLAAVDGVAS